MILVNYASAAPLEITDKSLASAGRWVYYLIARSR
jgi:hypothetical protein